MKQFISKSVIFILAATVLFHIKPLYLLYNDRYQHVVAGDEIYYAIKKSKSKNKSKKIIFGDSVGRQLFDSKTNHDTINSLASNQAISMAGHFILLNNYLNSGNQVDTVYFIFRPITFQNNLNQVYTYHYFLKPFYKKEYYQYFTNTVKEQVSKVPYNKFCRYPSVLTSNWAPEFVPEDEDKQSFLSPISIEYLKKIKELAVKHNFKLIILPTPMNLFFKKEIEGLDKSGIEKNGLGNEFKNYFENIIYLDNNKFFDSSHLLDPLVYTEYYKKKFIR